MIEWEGEGNLLTADGYSQLCPINAEGVMGAGLAAEMKRAYPELFERYRRIYHPKFSPYASITERAQVLTHVTDLPSVRVLLFCTKYHWRDLSPLALVEANLRQLSNRWFALGIERLAMPLVGTGLGGLSRPLIHELIHRHLGNQELPIRLYL